MKFPLAIYKRGCEMKDEFSFSHVRIKELVARHAGRDVRISGDTSTDGEGTERWISELPA